MIGAGYNPSSFETYGTSAFDNAAGWLVSLATGSMALGLCVLAIAVIGVLMLGGRLPARSGLRAVIGCFVLLGAPLIAAAFVTAGQDVTQEAIIMDSPRQVTEPQRDLPPSAFDPYAGASLRQD